MTIISKRVAPATMEMVTCAERGTFGGINLADICGAASRKTATNITTI